MRGTCSFLSLVMIVTVLAAGCSTDDPQMRTKAGFMFGAATGAALGAVLDKDNERGAAIGSVLGATLGGLAGYAWDQYDEHKLNRVLETVQSGQSVKWINPDTNIEWTATPTPVRRGHHGPVRSVRLESRDTQGNRRIQTIEAQRNAEGEWVAFDSRSSPLSDPEPFIEKDNIKTSSYARYRSLETTMESESVTLQRYPRVQCPDRVPSDEDLAVIFSLTEAEAQIPDNSTLRIQGADGKITFEGQAILPNLPKQVSWQIDVVLYTPDFDFEASNIQKINLPRAGDSTTALFNLKPKPIRETAKDSRLIFTLFHKGAFLSEVTKSITIIKKGENPLKAGVVVRGHSNSILPSLEPERIPAPPADILPQASFHLSGEAPDMTVVIREYPERNEGDIIISSQHEGLGISCGRYPLYHGLDAFLRSHYNQFKEYTAAVRGIEGTVSKKHRRLSTSKSQVIYAMRGFGENLYKRYAPDLFKTFFWRLTRRLGSDFRTIQIISDNPVLPWELMVPVSPDGRMKKGFLGTEYNIGRWHIIRDQVMSQPPYQIDLKNIIVIAPDYMTTGNPVLSSQADEVNMLQKLPGYQQWQGTFDAIARLFSDPPEGIIHFTGHGEVKEDALGVPRYVIILEDSILDNLAWRGFRKANQDQHPLFFFNACDVGQARQTAGFVDGWAPVVLESGASGYIGALWPISDKGAADFSIQFYEMILQMESDHLNVSETLRIIRSRFLENGDPSFLAYVFYGNPYLNIYR